MKKEVYKDSNSVLFTFTLSAAFLCFQLHQYEHESVSSTSPLHWLIFHLHFVLAS